MSQIRIRIFERGRKIDLVEHEYLPTKEFIDIGFRAHEHLCKSGHLEVVEQQEMREIDYAYNGGETTLDMPKTLFKAVYDRQGSIVGVYRA